MGFLLFGAPVFLARQWAPAFSLPESVRLVKGVGFLRGAPASVLSLPVLGSGWFRDLGWGRRWLGTISFVVVCPGGGYLRWLPLGFLAVSAGMVSFSFSFVVVFGQRLDSMERYLPGVVWEGIGLRT